MTNTLTITGRLTHPPILGYTPRSVAVLRFSVADNTRRRTQEGAWVDDTMYWDVEATGELAERAAETLQRGDAVVVTGRVRRVTVDGTKRHVVDAEDIGASMRWASVHVDRPKRRDQTDTPPEAATRDTSGVTHYDIDEQQF